VNNKVPVFKIHPFYMYTKFHYLFNLYYQVKMMP